MKRIAIAVLVSLSAALTAYAGVAPPAPIVDAAEAQVREAWRENIAHIAAPADGCFEATYPSILWERVNCIAEPHHPHYLPPRVAAGRSLPAGQVKGAGQTTGDGNDYVAQVTGLMSNAIGTFPTVTGVTSESSTGGSGGIDGANDYTLQINSNYTQTSAACNGHAGCRVWEQFVYSSGEQAAYMQYWLINYGNSCPSGWASYSGDCYKNSASVSVPKLAINSLANMKLSGSAVLNGTDTLVFTNGTKAYTTTGKDSVVDLASVWNQSEFNIVGDAGGSQATFNKGSSITVKLAVANGTTNAPTCVANAGSTGETNNLTLQSCTASGGSAPAIQFTESN